MDLDLWGRIEDAQTALGPDLSPQMNDVLNRLKAMPSGVFTVDELDLVRRWLRWQKESPRWFRMGSLWFGRNVKKEQNILATLQAIATRIQGAQSESAL